MFEGGDIVKVSDGERECVFLTNMYMAESSIATRIAEMSDQKTDIEADIDKYIEDIENKFQIEYAVLQKKAIKTAVQRNLFILTGGPGTGKTTTIKAIIEIFKMLGKQVVLTAPTGRAAQRMSQLCDYEAKTIHRLLEVDHRNFGDMLCFHKNEKDPVDADVVIVDECSMVDVLLMDALLKGIKKDANIILVGDYYQLPSVGAVNVLKDIIASD
jgi:exodeoxyribonuclease V alpha subunit